MSGSPRPHPAQRPDPAKDGGGSKPLVDPDDIYFPEAEDIGPHAIAFAQVMFAHSEFEREVCSLQGVITNDLSCGERRDCGMPLALRWTGLSSPAHADQLDYMVCCTPAAKCSITSS